MLATTETATWANDATEGAWDYLASPIVGLDEFDLRLSDIYGDTPSGRGYRRRLAARFERYMRTSFGPAFPADVAWSEIASGWADVFLSAE